jgi:hypothetical protein
MRAFAQREKPFAFCGRGQNVGAPWFRFVTRTAENSRMNRIIGLTARSSSPRMFVRCCKTDYFSPLLVGWLIVHAAKASAREYRKGSAKMAVSVHCSPSIWTMALSSWVREVVK